MSITVGKGVPARRLHRVGGGYTETAMNSGSPPGYDPRDFPPVAVTVDVVLFAIQEGELNVLLVERGVDPFRGDWALPGGFVQPEDGDLYRAASRELVEETGIDAGAAYLEQLATYGDVDRDPRMRVVSVAYWAACAQVPRPIGGSDAARAELVPVARIEDGDIALAFDHLRIVQDALDRLRGKLEYTALGVRFCLPAFTISELREVYEVVWNAKLDAGNFQRKVRYNGAFREVEPEEVGPLDMGGVAAAAPFEVGDRLPVGLRQAPASPGRRGGRPASLWTAEDPAAMLNSPIARPGSTEGGVR